MLAESVEGIGVKDGGGHAGGGGRKGGDVEAFEVDNGTVACVGYADAIGAYTVDTHSIAEVFDGASAEECGPGFVARARPVGTKQKEVVVEGVGVAEPAGETEVVAYGGLDAPTAPLEDFATGAASQLCMFSAHADGVGLVVIAIGAVGLNPMEPVDDDARGDLDSPGADKEGVVELCHAVGEGIGGALGRLGHGCHVVGKAGGEGFGHYQEVGSSAEGRKGLFNHAAVGVGLFPGYVLLEECYDERLHEDCLKLGSIVSFRGLVIG